MSPHSFLQLLKDALRRWFDGDAFKHAGALGFCTLFSLAPLVILLVAIVGTVYGQEAANGEVSDAIQGLVGEKAAAAVENAVAQSRLEEAGLMPTLFGIGALLFGATTVFAQMQSSLNHFWGVVSRPARSGLLTFFTVRLLSLGMVLIIGFLMLTAFAVSLAITGILHYAEQWMPVPPAFMALADLGVSLTVTTLLFGMLFKVMPDVYLRWGDVWKAAAVTALLFAVGKYLISFYLTRVAPSSTYGAAGSLVVILMWVYYSSLIIFFGTCLTVSAIVRRDGEVVPKPTAVRAKLVIQAD